MSILAEPRRKQKLSVDPQNLSWAKNEDAVGKKMLEKMGWNEGDGLGKNRHGMTNNLKLKANTRGKGLGASATNVYDSTWISHHDDFADLLSALNKNKSDGGSKEDEEKKAKKISLELNSKSLKRRIHYQKFTRAKDITNFDENAKKSVFGKGITNKVATVDHVIEVKKEIINTPEAEEAEQAIKQNHLVSSVSVGDYFKDKMAAKLAALKGSQSVKVEIKQEQEEYSEVSALSSVLVGDDFKDKTAATLATFKGSQCVKVEIKQEQEEYSEETEIFELDQKVAVKNEPVEEITSDEITIIGEKRRKKKRKHTKCLSDSEEITSQRSRHDEVSVENQPEAETVTKKKKKKSKIQEEDISVEEVEIIEEENNEKSKKKKSKKAKKVDEEIQFVENEEIFEESGKKKNKKQGYEK